MYLRAAYEVPEETLNEFRDKCRANGVVQTAFIFGCMRAYIEGSITWGDGRPVPPTQVSAGQTVPSLPTSSPRPRGRPTKPKEETAEEKLKAGGSPYTPAEAAARSAKYHALTNIEKKKIEELNDQDWDLSLDQYGRYIPAIPREGA